MVKLPRFFRRLFISLLFVISCGKSSTDSSKQEKKDLARTIFQEEFGEHDHLGPVQGTPKSMTLLDSILKLDPTHAAAWREISIPYLKRGMPLQWKPLIDKAVSIDAKTWQPMRGYLYLWFYRDYKNAILDFNASDTLTASLDYPQGHSVDFWRGIAYLGLMDYENSIAFWDKHIQKETEDTGEDWVELEAFLYRGIAYYEAGNVPKALENFDKVIGYFKHSADANYYKSLILLQRGEHQKALEFIDKAIEDFNQGYYNNRDYVETLRQIYLEDLEKFKTTIVASN